MFPYSQDIAHNHVGTLNNLHSLSTVCLNTTQQLHELILTGSRHFIASTQQSWTSDAASDHAWLTFAGQNTRLLDAALQQLCALQQAMLIHGEIQLRQIDDLLRAAIRHTEPLSPGEALSGLRLIKTGIATHEQAAHDLSVAAAEAIAIGERESHRLMANLEKSIPKRASGRRRQASSAA